jgi:NAD(P)-dependent dehydrogenase (short-subunit alcohol dehydrogenase family)
MNTTQRVAIVTGAGRGIGRAMTLGLLAVGIRVLGVDRDREPLDELAALAAQRQAGGALATLRADLTDEPVIADIPEATVTRFGRVDILVNNAGIGQGSIRADNWKNPIRFWEVEPAHWHRFIAVHSTAPFLLSRLVAPRLIAQGWGRIVNVTTSLGTMTRGGYTPYGPTKAATEALTSVMAYDLEGTGVTANVLVPGGVTNTTIVPDAAGFDRAKMLQPDIMAPPLQYLVSDAAAGVNGQRFLAAHWDTALPPGEAAAKAGAPAAWRSIATLPIVPGGSLG